MMYTMSLNRNNKTNLFIFDECLSRPHQPISCIKSNIDVGSPILITVVVLTLSKPVPMLPAVAMSTCADIVDFISWMSVSAGRELVVVVVDSDDVFCEVLCCVFVELVFDVNAMTAAFLMSAKVDP